MTFVVKALIVIAIELGVVIALALTFMGVVRFLSRRTVALNARAEALARATERATRNFVLIGAGLAGVGVLLYNAWLLASGVDAGTHTLESLTSITRQTWIAFSIALVKLALVAVALVIVLRLARRGLGWAETKLRTWEAVPDPDDSLASLFVRFNRALVITVWLLFAVLACWLLGLPAAMTERILLIVRIAIIVAVGLAVVRATTVTVDTLNGLSHRFARSHGWISYYERLRPLVPTFRACLEYVIWIATASLAVAQLETMAWAARWGPALIQAIGIFFLGRVAVEIGHFEIGQRLLPRQGIDEMERRRRSTMVPLLRSTFTYAAYFGTAVLILGTLGFNPMPFLAGAGIIGLVIGFGAQSLINDVVSGFFILFENIYLVGDSIEGGGAKGVVEAIEFRTTRIRDTDGRLHIVKNGDIKQVVNYSKDYTMAVVPVDVSYDADMRAVFATLKSAGERLQRENSDVLSPIEVEGITAFGPLTLTVRTATRVRPGRHEAVALAMRLAFKEAFDSEAAGAVRTALVPPRPRPAAASVDRK